jgi:TolB-like protein
VTSYVFLKPAEQTARSAMMAGPPSLLILPLEDTGGDPNRAFVARGLTYEIGTALTPLQNLTIYASEPSFGNVAPIGDAARDFTLMGSVQSDHESIRVAVFLMDSRTGRFLQSWSFHKDLAGQSLVGMQMEIARDIRTSLARDCRPIIGAEIDGSAPQARLDCRRLVALSRT